jgi:hypothetical protein
MDALFFSRRPEDHAALARAIANLDPAAFASLANAMGREAANVAHLFRGEASTADAGRQGSTGAENQPAAAWQPSQISSVGARHAVPERDAWHGAANSPRSVIPPALRKEGSEASAVSSFGSEQPVRAQHSRGISLPPITPRTPPEMMRPRKIKIAGKVPALRPQTTPARLPQCCERRRRRRRRCRDRIAGRAAATRRRREKRAHARGWRNLPRARCRAALESAIRRVVARRVPLRLAR